MMRHDAIATPQPAGAVVPTSSTWRYNALAAGLVLALMLPFVTRNFVIFQLTMAMIYAIAILGLNLLTGFNGQFSLGHSAFFAVGAYTAAIMIEMGGVPYPFTIIAAGLVCFAFGFLFGFPALRLEGIYLALATFALAIAMPQMLKFTPIEHWTGGVQGVVVTKPDAPFGLPLSADQWMYFVTLAVGIALALCAVNLVGSRSGLAMKAIRDNPIAARAMGINISLYKTVTFGISAAYTGIAGALSAIVVQFVAPDSFTFTLAIALFVGSVVGGVASVGGALFGGLFIFFVPHFAESISKGLAGAVYGLLLILVIYTMPAGAAGLWQLAVKRFTGRRESGSDNKGR